MNKNFYLVLSAACLMFLSCNGWEKKEEGNEKKDITKIILDSGYILVGFEPDAPPAFFRDPNSGNPKGFDYELIKFISKNAFGSATIKPIETAYDSLPVLLTSNKIQIMAGGRTVQDIPGVIYSKPYLTFGFCIITTKSNASSFTSLNALTGKKIGVYDESTKEWVENHLNNSEVSIVGDQENEDTPESDWMAGLLDGSLDAIIYDYPFASNEIGDYENKLVVSCKNLNDSKEPSEYVLAIPVGQKDLLTIINNAIDEYKKSPIYAKMVQEYIPNTSDEQEERRSAATVGNDAYIVKEGETLGIIANEHLGDPSRYTEIYELNRDHLASADIIYVGQRLRKPAGWK
jgi:ABC-type amino acid transport substrate-binding protein